MALTVAAWYYTKARRLQHDIRPRPQKLSLEPIVLMRQEKITCTFRGMLKKPTKPTIKNYIKIRWKGNFIRKKKKAARSEPWHDWSMSTRESCVLKANVDSVFCLSDTVIYWTHCILNICIVFLFQVLNYAFKICEPLKLGLLFKSLMEIR